MPLLPDLGQTEDTSDWNSTQKWSFAICTYLITSLFVGATYFAVINLVRFIRFSDACPHPLFFFYFWIILDMLSNIVWLVFHIEAGDD